MSRLVTVRITAEAHELVKAAADLRGEPIIDYLSRSAAGAARYDIAMEEARLRAIREKGLPKARPKGDPEAGD